MKKHNYSSVIIHQFDPEAPSPGGTDTCIRDMLKFMPPDERVLVIGVSETRPLNRMVRVDSISTPFDFLPVSRASPRRQLRMIPHSIRVLLGLTRALITNRISTEVVHIHRLEPGLLVPRLKPRRLAYFVHTNVKQALSGNSDSFWRRAPKLYSRLEKWVLGRAGIMLVFNQITSEAYASRGFNVERMRTWYDETTFFPSALQDRSTSEDKTLLWVGRIEAPKDPHFALAVFHSLHSQGQGAWRFSIVGDGTVRAELEASVAEWGLEDFVTFHGAVSREEVSDFMRGADVLLMTSHFEGSPLVLYEGMACGLPVVAAQEADPDEVIKSGTNGIKVAQREAEQFGNAIVEAAHLDRTVVAATVIERRASKVVTRLWELANS